MTATPASPASAPRPAARRSTAARPVLVPTTIPPPVAPDGSVPGTPRGNPSGGLGPPHPAELGVEVGPCPSLPATRGYRGGERRQAAGQPLAVRGPAAPPALLQPVDRTAVPA